MSIHYPMEIVTFFYPNILRIWGNPWWQMWHEYWCEQIAGISHDIRAESKSRKVDIFVKDSKKTPEYCGFRRIMQQSISVDHHKLFAWYKAIWRELFPAAGSDIFENNPSEIPVFIFCFDRFSHHIWRAWTGKEIVIFIGIRRKRGEDCRIHFRHFCGK